MALSKKLEDKINEQINKEFYSAYLYLSMAGYFERQGLKGFANKLYVQYQEEQTHAQKFYRYLNEKGGTLKINLFGEIKSNWENAIEVFEEILSHEELVTESIHVLVDIASEERDHATFNFLQWFVSEQVEEEATAGEILAKLKLINGEGSGMFMIDNELAQVTFVDATLQAGN